MLHTWKAKIFIRLIQTSLCHGSDKMHDGVGAFCHCRPIMQVLIGPQCDPTNPCTPAIISDLRVCKLGILQKAYIYSVKIILQVKTHKLELLSFPVACLVTPHCMLPVRAPMAAPVLLLLLPILAHLAISPASANENNLMVTGDVLGKDEQLSNDAAVFVMQNDCNLVLYNTKGSGFASNSYGQGTSCSLTLTDRGQLVVRNDTGAAVWTSRPRSKVGKYAAVLRPDGQVSVYGPSVWSTPNLFGATSDLGSQAKAATLVRNMLFSDQVLAANEELTTRDYTFRMQDDCNLVLTKAALGDVWDSSTAGKGKKCFATLNHIGELTVQDEHKKQLFITGLSSKKGDYVLVLQINGQVVIYGPSIWSTASP